VWPSLEQIVHHSSLQEIDMFLIDCCNSTSFFSSHFSITDEIKTPSSSISIRCVFFKTSSHVERSYICSGTLNFCNNLATYHCTNSFLSIA
jgi:hypothetical protein